MMTERQKDIEQLAIKRNAFNKHSRKFISHMKEIMWRTHLPEKIVRKFQMLDEIRQEEKTLERKLEGEK